MKNILLLDADSTIPNLALMKLSAFHKRQGDAVTLRQLHIPYYPWRRKVVHAIDTSSYDVTYCSLMFEGSGRCVSGERIIYGGTGFSLAIKLSAEIEGLNPDYTIYPDNDTSYGFLSRGCIRRCSFCKVPEKEGSIHQVATVSDIVHHDKVKFLDNNFLALRNHKDLLHELIDRRIRCEFNQGLDIRLLDRESSLLLSQLKYLTVYTFAFDNLADLPVIREKLGLMPWRRDWQVRFFVYTHPDMAMSSVVQRVEWLLAQRCYPYLMRHIACWDSAHSDFYVDLACWCNSPGLVKNMDFETFLGKRHPHNKTRVALSRSCYNAR